MDMQKTTLARVEETIRSSYRQIFAIDEPELKMPQTQVNYFADRALQQHLLVAVTMKQQVHPLVGHFTHELRDGMFLLHDLQGKIDHLIPLNQCTFIQRLK